MKTVKEIKEYIEQNYSEFIDKDERYDLFEDGSDFCEFCWRINNKSLVEHIDSEGGEGCGEYCHEIFKLTFNDGSPDAFIMFEGYYSSWCGYEYEKGFTVVKPVQVEVTKYVDYFQN